MTLLHPFESRIFYLAFISCISSPWNIVTMDNFINCSQTNTSLLRKERFNWQSNDKIGSSSISMYSYQSRTNV